jgi:hemin uptake protein HemP
MSQRTIGARDGTRRVTSRQLLDAGKRLLIQHRGQCYELRETRNGKLILTK